MVNFKIPTIQTPRRNVIDQHIAVFGESGSGKTTLLSTFYGWHQEPSFGISNGYTLNATDTSQGQELTRNYLKMQEGPYVVTRSQNSAFKFDIKVRGLDRSAGSLVWHDYPGEWWTEEQQGVVNTRKIKSFRALLQSDIAFLLCDAQRLKDDGDKYLIRLLRTFRTELERQKNKLKAEDAPLLLFPRTWVICLSKADLMPDEDVYKFRDRVIKIAKDELDELKETIKEILTGDGYQSIGESFLLLSSAEFDVATGKVKESSHSLGIDLIPPISISLPIQKALSWERKSHKAQNTFRVIAELTRSLTTNWAKYIPIVGSPFMIFDDLAKSGIDELQKKQDKAKKQGDAVSTLVIAFAEKLQSKTTIKIYISGHK
jgi:energy-coupling factor transporter ATP-binding protein EcfA2